jgi:uncharacterized membrane protein YfcA
MLAAYQSRRLYAIKKPIAAFGAGAAVAILGGLIGLGGGEFRLPILITVFALYSHRAVRINLLISFSVLAFSAVSRYGFTGAAQISSFQHIIFAMIVGGMVSAWLGAGYLNRIPKERVSTVIAVLLLAVASLLAFEASFTIMTPAALPNTIQIPTAIAFGFIVGAVSSLLGVAGGEFIIPILMFIFGADIETAGTASVLISTPFVLTGIVRHILAGKFRSQTLLARLVMPMSAGSILGAIIGGYATKWAPTDLLKVILAVILAASSLKLVKSSRSRA